MKYLREMAELARRQPIVYVSGDGNNQRPLESNEAFFKLLEVCQPFVFAPNKGLMYSDKKEVHDRADKEVSSAPFEVFSIEVLGGLVTSSMPGDPSTETKVVMAYEVGPNNFAYYALIRTMNNVDIVISSKHYCAIVNEFLKDINTGATGSERVREKFKVGSGKTKRYVAFDNVIHIGRKSDKYDRSPETGREIDWAYRFPVRGHWRSMPGRVGKDRKGDPIKDVTWVSDYVKGPENLPLISKTRLVEA